LEFEALTPDKTEWNLDALEDNPPRQIRLKQIKSLMKAFFEDIAEKILLENTELNITNVPELPIQSFLRGDFIEMRATTDYEDAMNFMIDFVKSNPKNKRLSAEISLNDIAYIFPKLINYKQLLRKLITFNDGWIEANSIVSVFSIDLSNSITNNIIGKYEKLDEIFELLINPHGLSFTEEELIEEYDYPDDDLDDIDGDYL